MVVLGLGPRYPTCIHVSRLCTGVCVQQTYMGMDLSMDEKDAPWERTSSRSRECSRSIDAIASGLES